MIMTFVVVSALDSVSELSAPSEKVAAGGIEFCVVSDILPRCFRNIEELRQISDKRRVLGVFSFLKL